MYYCDECRKDRNWPESMAKSVGTCECCGKRELCNDVSSDRLSPEKDNNGDQIPVIHSYEDAIKAFQANEITGQPKSEVAAANTVKISDGHNFMFRKIMQQIRSCARKGEYSTHLISESWFDHDLVSRLRSLGYSVLHTDNLPGNQEIPQYARRKNIDIPCCDSPRIYVLIIEWF